VNELIHYPLALVRRHFDQAAEGYDRHAAVQREIADRLLDHLEGLKLEPRSIVDIGCGTGYCARALQAKFPRASVTGIDLSPAMIRQAKKQRRWLGRNPSYRVGDAQSLDLAANSVDLLVSNLALQWCDPDTTFREFNRVLRPGGLVLLSSFGPDTLMELRRAWAAVDSHSHVHTFIDMHDLGDAMARNGLSGPVLDVDRLLVGYETVAEILRDLKGIGAQNLAPDRPRGLMGKSHFQAFCRAYESAANAGRLEVTYEAIYAHAWASERVSAQASGEVPLPFPIRRGEKKK
jgi:malonyl-CoA O-methyltransferase